MVPGSRFTSDFFRSPTSTESMAQFRPSHAYSLRRSGRDFRRETTSALSYSLTRLVGVLKLKLSRFLGRSIRSLPQRYLIRRLKNPYCFFCWPFALPDFLSQRI